MKLPRISIALLALAGAYPAVAQQYPAKPIRIIVPYPPGGVGDLVGRSMGARLGEALNQNVLVDNRPGGDTINGSEILARSPADGYTLLVASSAHSINPSLHKKLSFDAARDFAPVSLLAQYPYLIVAHPSIPAKSIKELVALAKANPGKLTYGTSSSAAQLAGGLLMHLAGVNMIHVPYKGSGPALIDLVGGHVGLTVTSPAGPLPFVRNGRLRVLAVTSRARSELLPNVSTVIEAGYTDYDVTSWLGMLAPAGVPREVLAKLNAELVRILKLPEVKEQFSREAIQPAGGPPEEFANFLKKEATLWAKAVQVTGLKAE